MKYEVEFINKLKQVMLATKDSMLANVASMVASRELDKYFNDNEVDLSNPEMALDTVIASNPELTKIKGELDAAGKTMQETNDTLNVNSQG